jgi:nucleoside-diphosphate-sugar epimerase
MRILVTGGAGRLGLHVCRALLHRGFEVKIFDLDNSRNRKNVRHLAGQAEIFWGDITSTESVRAALEDIEGVVHMAGILPPVAYEKPALAEAVNVKGTGILAGLLKEKGGHIPFIYTSSAAVFGPTPHATEPLDPDMHLPQPGDIYGETKYRAEIANRQAGIDFAILRLTATRYLSFEATDLPRMFSITAQ